MTARRHEVEDRIRRAKEFSDTVDNAEYDEAKTEQSFVEGRIQELERLLSAAKVIEEPPVEGGLRAPGGAHQGGGSPRVKRRPITWSGRRRPIRGTGRSRTSRRLGGR